MKVAAMILGIIGGLAGIGGAIFALFVGGIGGAFGANGAGTVVTLGYASIPFSILGIVGGAMSMTKPKAGAIMMIISAVGGVIAISMAYIIAGLLLLVGGILAFVASKNELQGVSQNAVVEESKQREITEQAIPWFKKKWVLALGGTLIIGVISGGIMASGAHTETPKTPKEEYPYRVEVKGLGTIKGIVVDDIGFAISGVSRTKTIGNSFSQKQAQGEFIVIDVVLTSHQKEAASIHNTMFKLIDSSGREYDYSTEGTLAAGISNSFNLKKVNPGITTGGRIVFDVPAGMTDFKLQVRSGSSKGLLPLIIMKDETAVQATSTAPTTSAQNSQVSVANSNLTPKDLRGSWRGENDLYTLSIDFQWDEGYLLGKHMATKKKPSLRTDGMGKKVTVTGRDNGALPQIVSWQSGYGNGKGEAEITLLDKNTMKWVITSQQGEHYLPNEMILQKK